MKEKRELGLFVNTKKDTTEYEKSVCLLQIIAKPY